MLSTSPHTRQGLDANSISCWRPSILAVCMVQWCSELLQVVGVKNLLLTPTRNLQIECAARGREASDFYRTRVRAGRCGGKPRYSLAGVACLLLSPGTGWRMTDILHLAHLRAHARWWAVGQSGAQGAVRTHVAVHPCVASSCRSGRCGAGDGRDDVHGLARAAG